MSRKGEKTSRISAFSGNNETSGIPLSDLGSSGESRAGSSPVIRIKKDNRHRQMLVVFFYANYSMRRTCASCDRLISCIQDKAQLAGAFEQSEKDLVQSPVIFAPVGAEQTSTGRLCALRKDSI